MRVIYDNGLKVKYRFRNPVLTIGIFDGVHLGHQLIIRKTISQAKRIGGTSIVLTFYPHPSHVLKSEELSLLVSLKHRLKLLESLNVDVCIVVDFTERFSSLNAEDFVQNFIIRKIKPSSIFVGADFTFGKDRRGNVELLKRIGLSLGFQTIKVSPLRISGTIVSSTMIRRLIRGGELKKAAFLLGRRISILGKVIKGRGVGKSLGFPTANICCSEQLLPPAGIYAVKAIINEKKLSAMAFNIGLPALSKERKTISNLEAHIFNFRKNIYGKEIEVEFYKRIRSVKRFKDQVSLRGQIENDAKEVKKFFRPGQLS